MSIISVPFLFLFFPLSVLLYYLIPCKKSMTLRNIFLILVSLVFYAWGEPICVFLICALVVINWLLGKLVVGKKGTKLGKWLIFIDVLVNAGALFVFKYLDFTLSNIGIVIGREFPSLGLALPLGLSFFCFHAISYVVDIYRGKVESGSLFDAALYLLIFFKVTQGPITQYNEFASQISSRKTTWSGFSDGVWRFALGTIKKALIATSVSYVVNGVFASDYTKMSVASAWLGCFAYFIQIYFDFSGYSDMAIGMGKMFGFELPENFDYPYMSSSITEYWRRWHISLGSWFRDYMFYPLTLGPAVKIRKKLAKTKISRNGAKLIQNIFVTGTIWFATGLWHGASWNYIIWGLINGTVIIWEMMRKPFKNEKLGNALGWVYTIAIAFFTKALVHTSDISSAISYYGAMFGLHGNPLTDWSSAFYIKEYWMFLLIGLLASFPIYSTLKKRFVKPEAGKLQAVLSVVEVVLLFALFVIAVAYLVKNGVTAFIYQKF